MADNPAMGARESWTRRQARREEAIPQVVVQIQDQTRRLARAEWPGPP